MSARTQKLQELGRLLQQTGHAHHQTFIETDGADPEWPLWYAEYLQEDLNRALGKELTVSELVYHLIQVTKEHEAQGGDKSWAEFAAIYFFNISDI